MLIHNCAKIGVAYDSIKRRLNVSSKLLPNVQISTKSMKTFILPEAISRSSYIHSEIIEFGCKFELAH